MQKFLLNDGSGLGCETRNTATPFKLKSQQKNKAEKHKQTFRGKCLHYPSKEITLA